MSLGRNKTLSKKINKTARDSNCETAAQRFPGDEKHKIKYQGDETTKREPQNVEQTTVRDRLPGVFRPRRSVPAPTTSQTRPLLPKFQLKAGIILVRLVNGYSRREIGSVFRVDLGKTDGGVTRQLEVGTGRQCLEKRSSPRAKGVF